MLKVMLPLLLLRACRPVVRPSQNFSRCPPPPPRRRPTPHTLLEADDEVQQHNVGRSHVRAVLAGQLERVKAVREEPLEALEREARFGDVAATSVASRMKIVVDELELYSDGNGVHVDSETSSVA